MGGRVEGARRIFKGATHLKATGSGKTIRRRSGPGDSVDGVVSTDREPSNLGSPLMGGVTLSLGAVEFERVG